MASANLRPAVLSLSADTGRAMDVLKHVGAMERRIFLDTLRPLNIARWAAITHRIASDPAFQGEVPADDARRARELSRALVIETAAREAVAA